MRYWEGHYEGVIEPQLLRLDGGKASKGLEQHILNARARGATERNIAGRAQVHLEKGGFGYI